MEDSTTNGASLAADCGAEWRSPVAKKSRSKSDKPWKPGDPLKIDKAIQQNVQDHHVADRLDRAEDALFSHVSNANRPVKPANHKTFNRQKKG